MLPKRRESDLEDAVGTKWYRWEMLIERIGLPGALLVALMSGGYFLVAEPLVNGALAYLQTQTLALERMSNDVRETRLLVESDKAERKAELIEDIRSLIIEQNAQMDTRIEELYRKVGELRRLIEENGK